MWAVDERAKLMNFILRFLEEFNLLEASRKQHGRNTNKQKSYRNIAGSPDLIEKKKIVTLVNIFQMTIL